VRDKMSFPTVDNVYTEGENYAVMGMAYIDPYLYVLYSNCKIHKINPETYAKISEWTAPSEAAYGGGMTTDCESLYVATSSPSPYRPIHVYKINPETMATIASWTGEDYSSGQADAESIEFDFQSERLLVIEDGYQRVAYRIYKLKQDLTEEMHKDAGEGPHSQYFGWDITILGDHCYIATGGTPGAIDKRSISDLSLLDYFEGHDYDPDDYIEGIFFNVCTDGLYLYTATYDYSERRPTRLIKVNPSNMTRVGTYYGADDELLGLGSYFYGGKIYILIWHWSDWEVIEEGEMILQINPLTMTRTARYINWTGNDNSSKEAVGDGSRLHIGFGISTRSVLQFAEEGTPLCIVCGKVAVGDKVFLLPIGNFFGNVVALKSDIFSTSDKAFLASLDEKKDLKLAFKSCTAKTNDKVICLPIEGMKENIVALR